MKQRTRDLIVFLMPPFLLLLACKIMWFFKSLAYRGKSGQDDYDAEKYWTRRHARFGFDSLVGVGIISYSEEANRAMYKAARIFFNGLLRELKLTSSARVFELGYGVGFYTGAIREYGIRDYYGADLVAMHNERLEADYPEYKGRFLNGDLGQKNFDVPERDMVFMIDVTQHIVNDDHLRFCLQRNGSDKLAKGGFFILTDTLKPGKTTFYNKNRDLRFYQDALPDMELYLEPVCFRQAYIFVFRKK